MRICRAVYHNKCITVALKFCMRTSHDAICMLSNDAATTSQEHTTHRSERSRKENERDFNAMRMHESQIQDINHIIMIIGKRTQDIHI